MLPWDWEGRKILLHGRCETPWLESERTWQKIRRRPAGERLGPPTISAGPDDDEPTVSETLRTGYTWKGKTLRPAMVKVSVRE